MGPYVVFRHLSICEDANKNIERIVGECPAIVRKRCRAHRVIRQNIREQCPCHALCLGWRISTCVLKSVREGSKETLIVRRFTRGVGIFFFYKYYVFRSPRTPPPMNHSPPTLCHNRLPPP